MIRHFVVDGVAVECTQAFADAVLFTRRKRVVKPGCQICADKHRGEMRAEPDGAYVLLCPRHEDRPAYDHARALASVHALEDRPHELARLVARIDAQEMR